MQTTLSNPVINAIARTAERASLTLDELRALRTIVWRAARAGASDFQVVAIGRRFVASCVMQRSIERAKAGECPVLPPRTREPSILLGWLVFAAAIIVIVVEGARIALGMSG